MAISLGEVKGEAPATLTMTSRLRAAAASGFRVPLAHGTGRGVEGKKIKEENVAAFNRRSAV